MKNNSTSSLEKNIRCTKCPWQGRHTIEKIKPQTTFENFGFKIATGLENIKCPKCGSDTIPCTKKMVS